MLITSTTSTVRRLSALGAQLLPIGGLFSVGATKATIHLQEGNRARCTAYSWILSVGSPVTYAKGEGTVRAAQDPSRSGDWF
jgi:hypothetical protein